MREVEAQYARHEAIGQHLAVIYDAIGEPDQAGAWLEKDFQQHSAELQHITWRVQFRSLRGDPRYVDLIRRMGLTP